MMLPLAQWIMQGRRQAIGFVLITLITGLIIWPNTILAAAAITLVTLRLGIKEGLQLSAWAIIPAGVFAVYLQNFTPLLLIATCLACSQLLRATQSWSLTLLLLSFLGLLAATGLLTFTGEQLEQQAAMIGQALSEFATQAESAKSASTEASKAATSEQQSMIELLQPLLNKVFLAGLFATSIVITGFLSLALGRSFQAGLYNPGGFQTEFHQLRLGKTELFILIVASLGILQLGANYLSWLGLTLVPLLVAGIAVFHAFAKSKKLAKHWYVLFYIVLIMSEPVKMILMMLAVVDCFINLRSKLTQKNDLT
jgi:uncharacterized protein YybS (DUF2232 family)